MVFLSTVITGGVTTRVRVPLASSRAHPPERRLIFSPEAKARRQSEKPFARVRLYAQVSDPLQGRPHHCGTNRARICVHTRVVATYFQSARTSSRKPRCK